MTGAGRNAGSSARGGSDGRVHAPPLEYDPVTYAPLTDLVEVVPSRHGGHLVVDAAARSTASR